MVAAKQGAHGLPVLWLDAAQAFDAGSPQQVDEKGLNVVIAVVGDGGFCVTLGSHDFLEEAIAELACRHLDAQSVFLGIVSRLELRHMQRNAHLATQIPYECLVAVTFAPAQVEVAMGGTYIVPQLMQHRQQAHRVRTAAQSHEQPVALREEVLCGNESAHFFLDFCHDWVVLFCEYKDFLLIWTYFWLKNLKKICREKKKH